MATAFDEIVPVLDFGSQYSQLICRRLRECGVYSELLPPSITPADLQAMPLKGIVFSGGPSSVYDPASPKCDPAILDLGVPILGICYGLQLAIHLAGGKVHNARQREYGRARLHVNSGADLLKGMPTDTTVWMSHGDQVDEVPAEYIALASTPTCPYAAVRHSTRPFFGVQFHPEVTHTPRGEQIFHNFLFDICQCRGTWSMGNFVEQAVADIRATVGPDRVICGLSGGVDSSVAAALIHKAIGNQLTCIFVDNGLLRKNERDLVEATFKDHFHVDLRVVDAAEDFLNDLVGVNDPQQKRRLIGSRFIDVFKAEAEKLAAEAMKLGEATKRRSDQATQGEGGGERGDTADNGQRTTDKSSPSSPRRSVAPSLPFLAQGTLYPDVIESGHAKAGTAANIKLHHNVGGLPEQLGFELIEPLRDLFKDEVRTAGEVLGLPEAIVWRHPFPGPGLAVRIIGDITRARLETLRDADEIVLEELVAAGLYRSTSQVFAVLIPIGTVGVMGDGRTYDDVIAIRAVETKDFMTADWARIPYDVLATMSSRIINEVRGVNRVVYDISTKPPATIEWE